MRRSSSSRPLFKAKYLPTLRPFSEVRALVERILAADLRVALASSAKADEVEVYKRIAGIDNLIAHDTSSDDAERSKPHPDIFQAALSKLDDLPPAQAIVVGDTRTMRRPPARRGSRPWACSAAGSRKRTCEPPAAGRVYRDPAKNALAASTARP